MSKVQIVSQDYFKYDQSDYAKSLRKIYGEDGYKKYKAKMNSVMTNPLSESKEKYTQEKKEQYYAALANLKKTGNIWSGYKNQYNTNLNIARAQNGGLTLSSTQRNEALKNAGDGAFTAQQNFKDAQSEVDYALSLYNDATHSGMWMS